jgi:hypothetical protein
MHICRVKIKNFNCFAELPVHYAVHSEDPFYKIWILNWSYLMERYFRTNCLCKDRQRILFLLQIKNWLIQVCRLF